MFVLTSDLNAIGKIFSFLTTHHIACLRLRRNVFCCLLLFSINQFDQGAYGVRGLNCTLSTRQKYVNLPLMYLFPLSITKISGILNLTIQRSSKMFNALAASLLVEG